MNLLDRLIDNTQKTLDATSCGTKCLAASSKTEGWSVKQEEAPDGQLTGRVIVTYADDSVVFDLLRHFRREGYNDIEETTGGISIKVNKT